MALKKQLTFYIPKELVQDSKIAAVKNKMSYSDFVVNVILMFCEFSNDHKEEKYVDELPKRTISMQDKKVAVYMYPIERQLVKLYAVKKETTLSNFIYQALNFYFTNEKWLDHWFVIYQQMRNNNEFAEDNNINELNGEIMEVAEGEETEGNNCCKQLINCSLTPENAFKIKMLGAVEDTNSSQLISRWLKSADCKVLNKLDNYSPKSSRSSLRLDTGDLSVLNQKAANIKVGVSEFINRLIAINCDKNLF